MPIPTEANRLRVLRSIELLDVPPVPALDRLTRLAARLLGAPVALVSLVDAERQFFQSAFGLGEPWASRRQTPLTHSFCQYAVRDRAPLVTSDAREHPILRTNPAIAELGVVAYAGMPLIVQNEAVGVLCVVDSQPRAWSNAEIELLSDLAASVVSEIELRLALRLAQTQRAMTDAVLASMGDAVLVMDDERVVQSANDAAQRMFGPNLAPGAPPGPPETSGRRFVREDGSVVTREDGPVERALRGEATDAMEFAIVQPGAGDTCWVEASGRPVRDADGRVVAGVVVYRDVTARKRQADLYAAFAANIPRAAVALFDAALRCLALDGGLVRDARIDPRSQLGRPLLEIAAGVGLGALGAVVVDMCRGALDGDARTLDVRHDGRTYALNASPVRDALGRVGTGILLATDVTHERQLDAALRERELLYRGIVQSLPGGAVFTIDRALRYLSADGPALVDLVGEQSIVGLTVADVVSAANRDATVARYRRAIEGEPQRFELVRGEHVFELTVVPRVDDATGEVTGALILCYDVTVHRRARETAQRQQTLLTDFRAFVEHLPLGVTILRNGRITYVNPALVHTLGYDDATELVGRDALATLPAPDERAIAAANVTDVRPEGLARRLRCRRRDGTVRMLELTSVPFELDGQSATITASRDVTEALQLDEARAEATATLETFRLMVESVADYAIFQLDPAGRVRTWNAGARAIKGYEADEIIGRHFSVFYPPESAAGVAFELEIAAQKGRFEQEGWRVRKDGSRFWAHVVITALRDAAGTVTGYAKITRDLTSQKRAADATRAALAEKTAMLQEIHHRVKNNLQMISSLLSLQGRQIKDPAARALFHEARERVRSIALLHESLYQSDDLGRVDMRAYFDKLLAMLRRTYGDAGANVVAAIEPVRLPLDAAVPCGLIVNELVTNALKHAFRARRGVGRNVVRVAMGRVGDQLTITVADNGAGYGDGVDPAQDETLGLTLVRDLSAQLGGRADFATAQGARCTVQFPARDRVESET